jgi:nucleoside-diphosphate-sugar epimerase
MRVIVLGGTRFIGRAVAEALVTAGTSRWCVIAARPNPGRCCGNA